MVADGSKPILGRDFFDQLGITTMQKPCHDIEINDIDHHCTIKNAITKEFPELKTRVGKSKKSWKKIKIA